MGIQNLLFCVCRSCLRSENSVLNYLISTQGSAEHNLVEISMLLGEGGQLLVGGVHTLLPLQHLLQMLEYCQI